MLRDVGLFISHSWKYGDHYTKMRDFLTNRSYFNFTDYSIPSSDPIHNAPSATALRDAIEVRIKKAQVVIIPAGVYASYSKWIDEEIALANKHGKPILGVRPWGQERYSDIVTRNANEIVGWNTESIITGIRNLI